MMRKKVFGPVFMSLAVILLSFGMNCFAATSISWSVADAGLRLGIGLSNETHSTNVNLRVLLNNVGTSDLRVFIGTNAGHGIGYLFTFIATTADKTQYKIWDSRPEASQTSGGLVVPIVIDLAAGATREFVFPLTQLVYMAPKGKQVDLGDLLQRGCGLNASLEVKQEHLDSASMGGIPPPSTGRLWKGHLFCRFLGSTTSLQN